MIVRIITSPEGLRKGNFILWDSFVMPPNFVCARPARLNTGFEEPIRNPPAGGIDVAYLNLTKEYAKELLSEGNGKDLFWTGSFIAQLKNPEHLGDEFPKWSICFGVKYAEISFVHELQNYYEDWINLPLVPFE